MFSIKHHVTCVLELALARQELLVHGQRATTVKVIGHSPDLAAFSFNLLDDDGKFLVQTHIQDAIILNDGLGEGVTLSLMWAPGARDVATLAISGKRTPEPEFTRVEHGQTIGDPEVPLVVQKPARRSVSIGEKCEAAVQAVNQLADSIRKIRAEVV